MAFLAQIDGKRANPVRGPLQEHTLPVGVLSFMTAAPLTLVTAGSLRAAPAAPESHSLGLLQLTRP